MANEIRTKTDARATMTITLGSLAAGAARQSTMVANANDRPAALVFVKIRTGTAPTAGTVYRVYLLRGDGTSRTDGAGASDATFTPTNAPELGTIRVTASGSTDFYGEFDTAPLGRLGDEWGVAIKNDTNQNADATDANHVVAYQTYCDEVQ